MRAFLLVSLTSSVAAAYSVRQAPGGEFVRWQQATVELQVDVDASSDVTNGADNQAILNAISTWNNVTCAGIALEQTSTTTSTTTIVTEGVQDGVNRLAWIEDNRWVFSQDVLAITAPLFETDGTIIEADIAFNGWTQVWSTGAGGGTSDVESVVAHELGHLLGLQHVLGGESFPDPPTMAPFVDPNLQTRTLTTDDEQGVCFLYPAQPFTCQSDVDCPQILDVDGSGQEFYASSLECAGTVCAEDGTAVPGEIPLGGRCQVGAQECATGLFCASAGALGTFCSQSCDAGCPGGFACVLLPTGARGCLPESIDVNPNPSGTGELGEICTADSDCRSPLFCVAVPGQGEYCASACQDACPDEFQCVPIEGESGGACLSDAVVEDECTCDVTTACDASCPCDPECDTSCQQFPAGLFVLFALPSCRRRR